MRDFLVDVNLNCYQQSVILGIDVGTNAVVSASVVEVLLTVSCNSNNRFQHFT